jgi:hypothetical protein
MKFTTTLLACPAFIALASTAAAFQMTTTRVSVDSAGVQGNANSPFFVAISADGRFVAFCSSASNLVAGDTNNFGDIFVRDRQSGAIERVSVATGGAQGNEGSGVPSISADGRYVAFTSYASSLVASDTNHYEDVFVRDRQNGTTELVSVDSAGVQGDSYSIYQSISADGRFVAFWSRASNLVAGTSSSGNIFVRDRQNGTTELASVDSAGVQANNSSDAPSISADGRFVAFYSAASNLVAGDTNGVPDIFVHDRTSGTTERVSVATGGAQGHTNISQYGNAISADGRFVAFGSNEPTLVAGDTNGDSDVFVRDRQSGTTERVSIDSAGVLGNDLSANPSISSDGRFVAFHSLASNLVAGDTNGFLDVFVHDRQSGTTERVSVDSALVQGDEVSMVPAISADGRFVAFSSHASNLVAGDTNGVGDIFTRDRFGEPAIYCSSGTSSNGCTASIAASANPSLSLAHACSITVTSVEGLKSGILFYGIDNSNFTPSPWASGSTSSLCVKHPTQRTPIQNSGGTFNACDGSFVLDWDAYQSTHTLALGNPWSVGDKVYVQAWFRDPLAVKSTNLSNALEMTYVP